MKGLLAAAAIASAAVVTAPAPAQDLQNSKVEIKYEVPQKAVHRPIYERLRQRQVLEQLKQFLSPLRLPKKLPVTTLECGEVNAYYAGPKGILFCYDYIYDLERKVERELPPPGFTRGDAIVGSFLGVLFHELGHAVFDILDVPVFGREEDAADQIAGFIVQQFGPNIQKRMITGAAFSYWLDRERQWPKTLYSDEHGTDLQRYYNWLCLGYGNNPALFQELVDREMLPKGRAANCSREYQQVRNAFVQTILPFVDQQLMLKVRSMDWLRPGDFNR
jgi:hypothetical protein